MILKYHKTYQKQLIKHLELNDFLDGDNDRVRKYLIRHETEKSLTTPVKNQPVSADGVSSTAVGSTTIASKLWAIRNEQLANDNLVEPISSAWLAQFSREHIITVIDQLKDDEPWKSILADMTGDREPYKKFRRSYKWEALNHGFYAVLVEGPETTAETEIEARASGERSYATLYDITQVPYWRKEVDGSQKGKLQEIVFFADPVKKDDSDELYMRVRHFWLEWSDAANDYRYYSAYYTAEKPGVLLDSVDGMSGGIPSKFKDVEFQLESGTLRQGAFPFIPVELFDAGLEESVVRNVVRLNREHMNKKSVRDSINNYQGFQRCVAYGIDPDNLSVLSESIMAATESPQGHIDVIEAGDPKALTDDITRIEQKAVATGLMRTQEQLYVASKERMSAESKKLDMVDFGEYLDYLADLFEVSESNIFTFFWWFENNAEPPEPISVSIARDFNLGYVEGEYEQKLLTRTQSNEFGRAGKAYRCRAQMAEISEERFAPSNKLEDDQVRSELLELYQNEYDAILAADERDFMPVARTPQEPEEPTEEDVLPELNDGTNA